MTPLAQAVVNGLCATTGNNYVQDKWHDDATCMCLQSHAWSIQNVFHHLSGPVTCAFSLLINYFSHLIILQGPLVHRGRFAYEAARSYTVALEL